MRCFRNSGPVIRTHDSSGHGWLLFAGEVALIHTVRSHRANRWSARFCMIQYRLFEWLAGSIGPRRDSHRSSDVGPGRPGISKRRGPPDEVVEHGSGRFGAPVGVRGLPVRVEPFPRAVKADRVADRQPHEVRQRPGGAARPRAGRRRFRRRRRSRPVWHATTCDASRWRFSELRGSCGCTRV